MIICPTISKLFTEWYLTLKHIAIYSDQSRNTIEKKKIKSHHYCPFCCNLSDLKVLMKWKWQGSSSTHAFKSMLCKHFKNINNSAVPPLLFKQSVDKCLFWGDKLSTCCYCSTLVCCQSSWCRGILYMLIIWGLLKNKILCIQGTIFKKCNSYILRCSCKNPSHRHSTHTFSHEENYEIPIQLMPG